MICLSVIDINQSYEGFFKLVLTFVAPPVANVILWISFVKIKNKFKLKKSQIPISVVMTLLFQIVYINLIQYELIPLLSLGYTFTGISLMIQNIYTEIRGQLNSKVTLIDEKNKERAQSLSQMVYGVFIIVLGLSVVVIIFSDSLIKVGQTRAQSSKLHTIYIEENEGQIDKKYLLLETTQGEKIILEIIDEQVNEELEVSYTVAKGKYQYLTDYNQLPISVEKCRIETR